MKAALFFGILAVFTSCNGQQQAFVQPIPALQPITGDTVTAIDGEIRSVFQDADDNIWFGSNGGGVYKYNGLGITVMAYCGTIQRQQAVPAHPYSSILPKKTTWRIRIF